MGTIENLLSGFAFALQPSVLAYCLAGCVIGTIVGMLPGLGPLAAISLLLPATFGLNPAISLMVLAGVYYGAMYGGSTTSILMRIPGETASVVTCIDGYEMTKRGRSGAALFIAAVGSFVAGTFSVLLLMMVAPPLAKAALLFGPPEMTALLTIGVLALATMSQGSAWATLAFNARPSAWHDRHRHDDRLYALYLRHHRIWRRHRPHSRCSGPVRRVRDHVERGFRDLDPY